MKWLNMLKSICGWYYANFQAQILQPRSPKYPWFSFVSDTRGYWTSFADIVIWMVVIRCLLICIVLLLYSSYKKQIFMFSKNDIADVINLNNEMEQELQHTYIKQMGENITTNGKEQDEDEGLYANGNEKNMVTPIGDNDINGNSW